MHESRAAGPCAPAARSHASTAGVVRRVSPHLVCVSPHQSARSHQPLVVLPSPQQGAISHQPRLVPGGRSRFFTAPEDRASPVHSRAASPIQSLWSARPRSSTGEWRPTRERSAPPPAESGRVSAVFFDFDGTLSTCLFVPRLQDFVVSDWRHRHVLSTLTPSEMLDNFGGPSRLACLRSFLTALREKGVTMMVISHGHDGAIRKLLGHAELSDFFSAIYSADSPELQKFGHGSDNKAALIRELMGQMDLPSPSGALFVDDTEANIRPAEQVAECLQCARSGMTREDMAKIAARCGAMFS